MPPEALLIAAVVLAVVVLTLVAGRLPGVRHLVRTGLDMLDGSLGMYMLRDLLGGDTTTRRERRIAARHAREQAEIERRIGGPVAAAAEPGPMSPAAPTRLVVSGDPTARVAMTAAPATPEVAPLRAATVAPAMGVPRGRLLRDSTAVLVVGAIVVLVVGAFDGGPDGAVLDATGTPSAVPSTGVGAVAASPRSTASPPPTPAATPSAEPTRAPTPAPATLPAVVDLDHRLAGGSGGGSAVTVQLSWAAAAGDGITYALEERVDGGRWRAVDLADPAATATRRTLSVGRESTFRIAAVAADGTRSPVAAWRPITPYRHQESSSLARYAGGWRRAEGPSLSGGVVTYAKSAGSRVVVRFTGTDIAWIGTRTPQSGRAEIRIDGDLVDTIDLAAARVQYGRMLFRRHFAERGPHRLEIRAVGDGRIDVDAFVVLR